MIDSIYPVRPRHAPHYFNRLFIFFACVQVTLQVANGDRAKALKMLEDPDALMDNEEIQSIIKESAKDSGDIQVVEGVCTEGPTEASVPGEGGGESNGEAPAGELDTYE